MRRIKVELRDHQGNLATNTAPGGVVNAYPLGKSLAMWRDARARGPKWNVTHVATGFCVARLKTKRDAETLYRKLAKFNLSFKHEWDIKQPMRRRMAAIVRRAECR